jgi:hypothetical protein
MFSCQQQSSSGSDVAAQNTTKPASAMPAPEPITQGKGPTVAGTTTAMGAGPGEPAPDTRTPAASPGGGGNAQVPTPAQPTAGSGGTPSVGPDPATPPGGNATAPPDGAAGAPAAEPEPGTAPSAGAGGMPAELPAGDAPPVISDLMVEQNPNNTISCIVSWTTDVPATSEVQFGIGDVQFHITSPDATTDHRVLVIGMYEQSDYVIRAVSSNSAGSVDEDTAFTTGALPSEVPAAMLTVDEKDLSWSGWTMTNIMVGTGSGFGSSSPAVIVMYDEAGKAVWYYINGTSADGRGDISAQMTEDGNVLVGPAPGESPRVVDLAGNVVWEGPQQGSGMAAMTHHAGQISNGDIVVLRDVGTGNITGTQAEEYDADGNMVWSWSLLDHTAPPAGASGDWCHGNSTTTDLDNDVVYVNCRFLGLYKIKRSSGDILWHMGGTLTTDVPGDFTYPVPGSQFSDTHDPEIHDDGTIMFYDNGGYAGVSGGSDYHSRVVEYAVDSDKKEATLVWEFPGDFAVDDWYKTGWYSAYWGDADVLPNDNVLINAAAKDQTRQVHIFEVTREGQIVWEIVLPTDQGTYRAERLSPPPLVRPL